jgi:hypothetical protein
MDLFFWYEDVTNALNSYPTNNYKDKYECGYFLPDETNNKIDTVQRCRRRSKLKYRHNAVRPIILTLDEELDVIIPIFFRVVNRKSNELRIDLKFLWQQTNRTDKSKA